MSVRLRRLYAEYERLKMLFAGHEHIRIVEALGDPPDRYVIEYRVKGLTETKEGVQESNEHRVQITLGPNYPNEMASCIVVGKPVFHPNIDHLAVCTADVSSASRTLDQTIVFIGELITYQAFNLQSPRNGEAKKWTEANLSRLPLERISLVPRQLLEGPALPVPSVQEATQKPAVQPKCANCGQSDPNALKICLNHHQTCSDCVLPCSNCAATLCLACELQTCSECRQTICNDCTITCSNCRRKLCPAHAVQCPGCQAIRCKNCAGTCIRCGGRFCRDHLDMSGRCRACGALAVSGTGGDRLADEPPAPIAQAPERATAPPIPIVQPLPLVAEPQLPRPSDQPSKAFKTAKHLQGRKLAIWGLALGALDVVAWAAQIAVYIHAHEWHG